uniref:hypothetical protein n=1 Tax=Catenibacterium mitsuokai TaxID=100886 RepID=UPI003D78A36A
MSEKNLKEITYSGEFVNELESKIEYFKEENALIKRRYTVLECQNHYLELYKEALNLAITNAIIVGGYDFWERAAIGYGVQEFYNKCIHRNAPNLNKGIVEFYLSLIANVKAQKSEVKENVKCRKI